ncbi:MAG: 23S rRNA (guanosine(2251)-2'-O)-methyltransferase RlmB [Defluviicoccus sp.]|nr:23S rRNA (guanosine(2251)-2'-O)-methyltransferase RlmB [Defluviicoccus sp.]
MTRNKGMRAGRARRGAVWLYGRHAVAAALANPARRRLRLLAERDAGEPLAAHGPEIVDRDALRRILPEGAVHQGLALLAEPLAQDGLEAVLDAARSRERAAAIVLDRVQDPQNVGAVLRSAAALGALALVMPDRHAPPETGALAKAASGALESVPVIRVANLARALARMKANGLWCVGFDAGAGTELASGGLPDRSALVLGAEGRGLRRLTAERCDLLLRIPMAEGAASLNVSAAAAIALYAHAQAAQPGQAGPSSASASAP